MVAALDLAVVPGRVGADPLMPVSQGFHGAGEVLRPVVGPVVADHPVDPGDPVGSEERPCAGEEADPGGYFLILTGLGVGQEGEAVQDRVQVGVPGPRPGSTFGRRGGRTAAAVGPPATTIRVPPECLHIQVDHVPSPRGPDALGWVSQVLPIRGEITQPGDPQPHQPADHGAQMQLVPQSQQVMVDPAT